MLQENIKSALTRLVNALEKSEKLTAEDGAELFQELARFLPIRLNKRVLEAFESDVSVSPEPKKPNKTDKPVQPVNASAKIPGLGIDQELADRGEELRSDHEAGFMAALASGPKSRDELAEKLSLKTSSVSLLSHALRRAERISARPRVRSGKRDIIEFVRFENAIADAEAPPNPNELPELSRETPCTADMWRRAVRHAVSFGGHLIGVDKAAMSLATCQGQMMRIYPNADIPDLSILYAKGDISPRYGVAWDGYEFTAPAQPKAKTDTR